MNEAQRHLLRQQLLLGAKPDLRRGEITDATPGAVMIDLGASGVDVPAEVIAGGGVVTGDIVDALVAGNAPPLVLAASAPSVRVYHNADVAVWDTTWWNLAFNSELHDNNAMHSSGDNTKLVAKAAGVYAITGSVIFASNATGYRVLDLLVNSTTSIAGDSRVAVNGTTTTCSIATQIKLAANDYVQLRCYQNSGGNLTVSTYQSRFPGFAMTKISDG